MQLLALVLGGFALVALVWWLEHVTRRPGLALGIAAPLALIAGVLGLAKGLRLLPLIFFANALTFLYMAYWQRTTARAEGAARAESAGADEA